MFSIIDLETTGIDPFTERVTEIAYIIFNGHSVLKQNSYLINPEIPIPPDITKLTSITDDMVKHQPLFKSIFNNVLNEIQNTTLVSHNALFDHTFLKVECERNNINFNLEHFCSLKLSRKVFPKLLSYKLSALKTYFKFKSKVTHRALDDAQCTLDLFKVILEKYPLSFPGRDFNCELKESFLPRFISYDKLMNFPERSGTLTLFDNKKKKIYEEKMDNLRAETISFFLSEPRSKQLYECLQNTFNYQIELVST